MRQLEATAAETRSHLERINSRREEALKECREVIRLSSRTIRAIHRQEFVEAAELLEETKRKADSIRSQLVDVPEVYYAGYIHDSQKEYVEASVVFAVTQAFQIPDLAQLQMEPAAYLNGLAEAGSECRRYVLDRLKNGDTSEAERILVAMDEIYFELVGFDFPDAITGGLRRTTDAFRAVLERTRGDLTLSVQHQSLRESMQNLVDKLEAKANE